jgi:hypothetical protein
VRYAETYPDEVGFCVGKGRLGAAWGDRLFTNLNQLLSNIKSVSIGIIQISILDLSVNPRQSIVIPGPRNSLCFTADTGRLTQINADELY